MNSPPIFINDSASSITVLKNRNCLGTKYSINGKAIKRGYLDSLLSSNSLSEPYFRQHIKFRTISFLFIVFAIVFELLDLVNMSLHNLNGSG
jgi:hypothetical protein